MGVLFNPFSGVFDFTGSGGGSSTFAGLTDLTTAVVAEIDIDSTGPIQFINTDIPTSVNSGLYLNVTGSEFFAQGPTLYAAFAANVSEAFGTAYTLQAGAQYIENATYGVGDTALLTGVCSHVFTADPGANVVVDHTKNFHLLYVNNSSGGVVTFEGATTETFNGTATIDLEDGKAYMFLASQASTAYKVFISGTSSSAVSGPDIFAYTFFGGF